MKRFITAVAAAAGLSLLAVGGLAVASPGHDGPPGIEGHVLRLIQDLDLTDAQKTQLREIREANRPEREAARADREATMELMREQLLSDTPDAALLHALIDEQAAEMQARMHDRLDTVLEVQAILTPAQRQEVAAALDDARERFESRRERFRNGEGPRAGQGPRFGE